MTAKALKDVLQRVEAWPEEAQEERSGVASEAEVEAGFETFRHA